MGFSGAVVGEEHVLPAVQFALAVQFLHAAEHVRGLLPLDPFRVGPVVGEEVADVVVALVPDGSQEVIAAVDAVADAVDEVAFGQRLALWLEACIFSVALSEHMLIGDI